MGLGAQTLKRWGAKRMLEAEISEPQGSVVGYSRLRSE